MRVLMLGWEFPPHISGGLGTACQGLTEALAEKGVELIFLVPRLFGDEEQNWMRMQSCDEVLATHPVRTHSGKEDSSLIDVSGNAPGQLLASRRLVTTHTGQQTYVAIDSALHPYLNTQTYAHQIETLRQTTTEDIAELADPSNKPYPSPDDTPRYEIPVNATTARPSFFSGRYGASLMEEVELYAEAALDVASRTKFDLVHAHDWMTYPAALRIQQAFQRPLVTHIHASEHDRSGDNVNQTIKDIESAGFHAADRIICVSHFTASVLKKRYGVHEGRLRIVHNAVKHRERRSQDPRRTIEEPIVLFLGRVTFQKGPDYFLQAARKVVDVLPDVKFVLAGDGDMLRSMIERCASLGLARNVHFTGFLRGSDVERMYAMADLYIMPSVSEPFGIAPLEAIALDTPVIVSKQSGVSEVLRHALKVDYWDVDDLANKIISVLRHPALRQSLVAEARREIRHMQWSIRADQVVNIYKELLA